MPAIASIRSAIVALDKLVTESRSLSSDDSDDGEVVGRFAVLSAHSLSFLLSVPSIRRPSDNFRLSWRTNQ
eukprot:12867330-Ditylum_brightwellii.AAC.1